MSLTVVWNKILIEIESIIIWMSGIKGNTVRILGLLDF